MHYAIYFFRIIQKHTEKLLIRVAMFNFVKDFKIIFWLIKITNNVELIDFIIKLFELIRSFNEYNNMFMKIFIILK